MKFKKPSKKYSNFSCFLILLGIFIADSFVKADPFKLGEKDFPYQKLEKVDEQAIDKEKESFQIIANKIEEIKKEASGIGNLDKFEENALPVIEILTDDNKQKIYINEIGKINKLDGQIPTFFKDALKFEEFVKHFNNRFQIVNNDSEKKTSKTMKQKFQVCTKVARDRLITSFIVPCGGSKREERREKSATGKINLELNGLVLPWSVHLIL